MAELEDAPWVKKEGTKPASATELPDAPWATTQPGTLEDMAKVAPGALTTGILAPVGMGGDLQGMMPEKSSWLEKTFPTITNFLKKDTAAHPLGGLGQGLQQGTGDVPGTYKLPSTKELKSGVEKVTGPMDYQAQTPGGKILDTSLKTAPSLFMGGEGLVGTGLKAAGAGLGSEGAGEAAHSLKGFLPKGAQPYAEPVARSLGAIGGAMAITPNPMTDAQLATTSRLQQANPELLRASSAGQLTDREWLRSLEGVTRQNAPQQEAAFTQGVTRQMGAPPGSTFPQAVAHGDVIGNNLRNIRQANNINPAETSSLIGDLRNLRTNFATQYGQEAAQALDAGMGGVPALTGGPGGPIMQGTRYDMALQNLQNSIEAAPNSQTKMALSAVRDRFKQAFRNSVPPDVAASEEQLSHQYAVNSAASRIKPELGRETVTPQEVLGASSKMQGPRRTNANEGDLAPLAQDASRVMKPLPTPSGQVPSWFDLLTSGVLGAVGAGGAGHGGGLPGAIFAGEGSAVLGHLLAPSIYRTGANAISRAANNGIVQSYLGNQVGRAASGPQTKSDLIVKMLMSPAVNHTDGTQ